MQDVAERIGRESKRRGQQCRLMAMDAIDISALVDHQKLIFVASTTGQVCEPDQSSANLIYSAFV